MLPVEEIKTEDEFNQVCLYAAHDFTRICEWIRKGYNLDILSKSVKAPEREILVHKYHNLANLISQVQNAAETAKPSINTDF